MKNIFIVINIVTAIASTAPAQTSPAFKPFKVDAGFGIGEQSSEPPGFLLFLEPSYCFANKYKAGIRFEQAILSMKSIGSSAITFDYYITSGTAIRTFAGGGYSYFSTTVSGGCDPGPGTAQIVRNTKKSGALLRAGFELYHFRLSMEYNFVPSTYVSAVSQDGEATSTVIYKNGYLGIKGSISIGGARKKFI